MHLSASRKPNHLPKQFPVGTTYVVEGRGGEDGAIARIFPLCGPARTVSASIWPTILADPASPRVRRGTRSPRRNRFPDRAQNPPRAGAKKLWLVAEPLASAVVNSQAPGEAPQPLTLNHPASNPGRFCGRGSSFWQVARWQRSRTLVGDGALIRGRRPDRRDGSSRPGRKSRESPRYRPTSGL